MFFGEREIETADILIAFSNEFITQRSNGVSAKSAIYWTFGGGRAGTRRWCAFDHVAQIDPPSGSFNDRRIPYAEEDLEKDADSENDSQVFASLKTGQLRYVDNAYLIDDYRILFRGR